MIAGEKWIQKRKRKTDGRSANILLLFFFSKVSWFNCLMIILIRLMTNCCGAKLSMYTVVTFR